MSEQAAETGVRELAHETAKEQLPARTGAFTREGLEACLMDFWKAASEITQVQKEQVARQIAEYWLEGETKTRIAHHAKEMLALLDSVFGKGK